MQQGYPSEKKISTNSAKICCQNKKIYILYLRKKNFLTLPKPF